MYGYYQQYCVCDDDPVPISMRDLQGDETTSYPVDVYNVNQELIGVANNKAQYISIWNGDPDNQEIGILMTGLGPFGFKLLLNPGEEAPEYVIGVSLTAEQQGIYAMEYADEYE